MGATHGFIWKEEAQARLKTLVISGSSAFEIAAILTREFGKIITYSAVIAAKERYGLNLSYLAKNEKVKTYECLTLKTDDYMISCDYHSPYVSELYINRFLYIADKFKIKKNIIIGDLFDFDFVRARFMVGEERSLDKEVEYTEPIIKALNYFDENTLVTGNHERRVDHYAQDLIKAKHLFGLFGAEIWAKKFKYSIYDKLYIGKDWMLVHPHSYRQVKTSVAQVLAEKYHRNIINTHGHFVGMAYERSGTYLCIDLGGMFDRKKMAYINLQTTTHPTWNNGFGMFLDGYFHQFHEGTDMRFWT